MLIDSSTGDVRSMVDCDDEHKSMVSLRGVYDDDDTGVMCGIVPCDTIVAVSVIVPCDTIVIIVGREIITALSVLEISVSLLSSVVVEFEAIVNKIDTDLQ